MTALEEMTALEKMQGFIEQFPESAAILKQFRIDYTDKIPGNGGLFPDGLVEINRKRDILGNVEVENQYNFGLYCVLDKDPGDKDGAEVNAAWLMNFQDWVQEKSAKGEAPVFGDEPWREKIIAQNGALYNADEEGTAVYMVQIAVSFVRKF